MAEPEGGERLVERGLGAEDVATALPPSLDEAFWAVVDASFEHRIDPSERLQNPWYQRLLAILRHEGCAVRWSRDQD